MPYPRISKSRTGHHEFESGKRNAVLEILSSPNEVFQTSLGGEQLIGEVLSSIYFARRN